MSSKPVISILVCILAGFASSQDDSFTYNGFRSAYLTLDGLAKLTSDGLLQLTNLTGSQQGHAFYPNPLRFKNSENSPVFSFSTSYVCAAVPQFPNTGSQGIAFFIAPQPAFPGSFPVQYFGLFNQSSDGKATNHVFAVELDIFQNSQFGDINDNHIGIDINGLTSVASSPAGYYADDKKSFRNVSLISGEPVQVWVEFYSASKKIDVTLAPLGVTKPNIPILTLEYDLSPILKREMYVGFSSSTGGMLTSHYVLGWSFKINGSAKNLVLSQLPRLPRVGPKKASSFLTIGLPIICVSSLATAILGVVLYALRRRKFAEILEDWELDYGPHRFKYKDLYIATKGFAENRVLGKGGFGAVYRGTLPGSGLDLAVKRVSHESRQGIREFIAEIVSIGRLRHRNLVPLLGYCRHEHELFLVYEYMPNGSLDKYLYGQPKCVLGWTERYRIIKGVASGLLYLHEEWEQVVVHRDVKASNVLLDGEFNGRLGDFGLARLYDHGTDPQTTHVVGTLGYLDPAHTLTGKATTKTDVYAFGAFLLEVATGRRPTNPGASNDDQVLVDWVFSCWKDGNIPRAVDPNLGGSYVEDEVELVLRLGLLCSHSEPMARPGMRHILMYLEGSLGLPELSGFAVSMSGLVFGPNSGFDDVIGLSASSMDQMASSSIILSSLDFGGR